MDVRIATCRPLPEPDPDEPLLLEALSARGLAPRMVAWDDAREDWARPAPTLVRSTWDYLHREAEFRAWIARVRGPLANPREVLLANLHKGYLLELAARGVPTVATTLVRRGERVEPRLLRGDVIVKPAVSAASFRTERFAAGEHERALTFASELARERDVLIQPWMREVERSGERALVWIAGEVTHAVRKSPRLAGGVERVELAEVAGDERALARDALADVADRALYGRVDVVRDERGRPVLMELELLEPSLFFAQSPAALDRFARAVEAWALDARARAAV